MAESQTILLVDDLPANLRLLYEYLQKLRYRVLIAQSGEAALSRVAQVVPDLVLLDAMMPTMDGFETCRQLKGMPDMGDVPVIFITALDDVESKLRAFEVGAVDYVTKPMQHQEVIARIRTHLHLRQLQRELAEQIEYRNSIIAELDSFAHTVAHDLRNPLNSMLGAVEMLSDTAFSLEPKEQQEMAQIARRAARRMEMIIKELLLLSKVRQEQVERVPLDLQAILLRTLEHLEENVRARSARIHIAAEWPVAIGQEAWIEEVWVNYLTNALKYGGVPPEISCGACLTEQGRVRCWVEDRGPGIAEADRASLFVPFTRLAKNRPEGIGLGLSIVERILSRLGGSAGYEPAEPRGSRFYFELPAAP